MLRDRSGVTLVELVLVLVVLAVLVGLAAPRMGGWVGVSRLEGTAAQLRSDVAYARSLAVRSGRPALVTIGERGYVIRTIRPDGDTVIAKRIDYTQEDPLLRFEAGAIPLPMTLRFNSRGLLQSEQALTLSARRDGRQVDIRVLPTGRVRRD